MRALNTLLCIAGACLVAAHAENPSVRPPVAIEKVYVATDGQIHIVSGGKDLVAPKEQDQADCNSPKLAGDGETAGWLVESENCCTTYPIPLSLVIYRGGRVMRRFEPGQSIWDWQFVKGGKQVAFWIGPTHGAFEPHFELHDVSDGRLRAQWDGHLNQKHPSWVSGLKE